MRISDWSSDVCSSDLWQYGHAAIISAFNHARPHENVAYEIFYPTGPFALLPLPDDDAGHRSAIVWSVAAKDAAGMLKLSDRAFLVTAEKRRSEERIVGQECVKT